MKHSLTVPCCSDNSFSAIRGLEKCKRLSHLSLTHNNISRIRGLDHLPLRKLCLVLNTNTLTIYNSNTHLTQLIYSQ